MKNLKKTKWGLGACLLVVLFLPMVTLGEEPATENTQQKMEPWRLEIQEIRASTAEQLTDLQEEHRQAGTPAEARRIEGEIRDLKLGVQVEILEIQAAEALRLGDEDLAKRFEDAIKRHLEKPEKKEPVERHNVQSAIR